MTTMDLIILPFHDWKKNETEGLRNRDGHLLTHFLNSPKVGKILMIDRPISMPERVLKRRPLRCKSGRLMGRSGRALLSRVDDKLYVADMGAPDVISPLVLRRDWWDAIFRRKWVQDKIRWAADAAGLNRSRRVLFCMSPLATGPFGQAGEQMIVFDADDNWCNHPIIRDGRGWIRRGYETACRRADLLTCNNPNTADFLESLGRRPEVIRNGVDLDRWDPDRWAETPVPASLARIPRPWIGYAGRLAKRTDVELIEALARRRPEWSIVLVGPVMDQPWHRPLEGLTNVHFLGDIFYDDLPSYVARFDVACIFHLAPAVENMDPTKLYEYIALGLPCVTTDVAGVETFRNWIAIEADAEGFETAIASMLERRRRSPTAFMAGRQAVIDTGFTWRSRAETFLSRMEQGLLGKKNPT